MADTVVNASGNVYFHVNDDQAVWNANVFAVQKNFGKIILFYVTESGEIFPTLDVRRAGPIVLENSNTGDTNVCRFRRDGSIRLTLSFDGTTATWETPSGSGTGIRLESGTSSVYLYPDYDNNSSVNYVRVRQSGGNDRFRVGDDLTAAWFNSSSTQMADYEAVGSDVNFRLGNNAGVRGHLRIQNDSDAAGALMLQREDSGWCFLWVDVNGVLRIDPGDPLDEGDTGGTVVGSQT